jgi:hypothetical protein
MKNLLRTNRRQLLAATGLLTGSLFLPSRRVRAQAAAPSPPRRLVILFTQHGTVYGNWKMRPAGQADSDPFSIDLGAIANTEMSEILRPLHAHREKLLVLDGLSMASAEADEPGNGHDIGTRHALTGALLRNGTAGGSSIDQLVARRIAVEGRIDSLELSVGGAANGGAVWRGAGQAISPDTSAGSVFDRLFPGPIAEAAPTDADRVRAAQASVLDLVRAEYEAMAPRLSREDRQKLELHRDLVRNVELRVREPASARCERPARPAPSGSTSATRFEAQADAMFGLVAAAFACDLTRVVTLQMGQLSTEHIGAPPGDVHADFAHQQEVDQNARRMMTNYGRVHATHMARLLSALDAVPEAGGTLLDSCAVVWCSELADGVHHYRPWPVVVGGGALRGGRYVNLPRATPNPSRGTGFSSYQPLIGPAHNRFWLGVGHAVGADVDSVGERELQTPSGERISCTTPLAELA